jgi:glutathione S-transferase
VKFYNSMGPNPKLVRMFAAEKGYEFAAVEDVDLIQGANRKEPYLTKNPSRASSSPTAASSPRRSRSAS